MPVVIMAAGWEGKIRVKARPFVNRAARKIGQGVEANIIESGLVATGELLQSVHVFQNRVYIGASHWIFLEYGTVPHGITAKPGGALYSAVRNFGPAKHVNHPGNRAYAPIRRAVYKRSMRIL